MTLSDDYVRPKAIKIAQVLKRYADKLCEYVNSEDFYSHDFEMLINTFMEDYAEAEQGYWNLYKKAYENKDGWMEEFKKHLMEVEE